MSSIASPVLPAFGMRLRQLRRAAGIKQFALSNALGIDQSSVSRWEAGHQLPDANLQQRTFALLTNGQRDDSALRRLVETSTASLHLIEDATHICLAYSKRRAAEWGGCDHALLKNTSLWRFATKEIEAAESALQDSDWWSSRNPTPRSFCTSAKIHDEILIKAGRILWERMYLSDGTPVRLCTAYN